MFDKYQCISGFIEKDIKKPFDGWYLYDISRIIINNICLNKTLKRALTVRL